MDFLSSQRAAMDQRLSDAEATQHRLAKQQLDLEERQRQLDQFEKVVRHREQEVLHAEARAALDKFSEAAAIKQSVVSASKPVHIIPEMLFNRLMERGLAVGIIPDQPYSTEMQALIKAQGLKLTTHVPLVSDRKSIFCFSSKKGAIVKNYSLNMVMSMGAAVPSKAVEIVLTPIDNRMSHFLITAVRIGQ